ncbi:13870_t:CDS:2 [Cetraspora pellucida]|uniref:13870_t:CDS:1 n=1 Tax=Cetraspora pellucida TaxID=1433469 RepID=A0A9N9BAV6_9GLOM|nr:13870_t:CDS:2 [Cetraspora pellucida]
MGISDASLEQKLAVNIENKMEDFELFPNAYNYSHIVSCSNCIDESLKEKTPSFKQSLQFSGTRKRFMPDCENKDSEEIDYLLLARQIALKRVYMVRVANENSWGVAAKMALNDLLASISQLFKEKRKKTRLAA